MVTETPALYGDQDVLLSPMWSKVGERTVATKDTKLHINSNYSHTIIRL